MTMLDQPHQIEFFKLAQVCSRLKIEIGTDLSFRQPTLKYAKRYYRLKVSTKRGAWELLDAAKARVLEGSNIYFEIAQLRGSRFFFHCGACGWEGDEFTIEGAMADEAWSCPNCKHDESALDIQRLGSI